jgi:uncharacterized spore protein YtfJ
MSTGTTDLATLAERDNFLNKLAETVGANANVANAFGEPITRNGVTVVPVARLGFGFGGGAGHQSRDPRHGVGGGGGGGVQPVGYIVIRGEEVTFRPISSSLKWIAAVLSGIAIGAWLARR